MKAETVEALIERVVLEVAELPDRTSPDDWPEAMLVTASELRAILAEAVYALPHGADREARRAEQKDVTASEPQGDGLGCYAVAPLPDAVTRLDSDGCAPGCTYSHHGFHVLDCRPRKRKGALAAPQAQAEEPERVAFVAGWDAQRRLRDELGHAGEVVYAWKAWRASVSPAPVKD